MSNKGRPDNSYSFVGLSLKELKDQLASLEAVEETDAIRVIVSRKWLSNIGIDTSAYKKATVPTLRGKRRVMSPELVKEEGTVVSADAPVLEFTIEE